MLLALRIGCGRPVSLSRISSAVTTRTPSFGHPGTRPRAPQVMTARTKSILSSFRRKKKKSAGEIEEEKEEKAITLKSQVFQGLERRDPASMSDIIDTFVENTPNRRGHIDFINACLRNLEEFGAERDLEVYKKLLNVFPKEKMVAKNQLQVEFMHFPRHQQCAIDVLEKMENNGVIPDESIQMTIMETFGYRSFPMRKYGRMMYWMPKFKNASPFPIPRPLPRETIELALLALKRISGVDLQSEVTTHLTSEVEDSVDDTWIVGAQSPDQQKLIAKHPDNIPLFVEGANRIWLRDTSIAYFTLRADPIGPLYEPPEPDYIDDVSNISCRITGNEEGRQDVAIPPCVHEQEDGTIMANCATGTSSPDSLLSWIRILQKTNPRLREVPVLFKLKAPSTAVVPVNSSGLVEKDLVEHVPNQSV